jgi:hypothetical protein
VSVYVLCVICLLLLLLLCCGVSCEVRSGNIQPLAPCLRRVPLPLSLPDRRHLSTELRDLDPPAGADLSSVAPGGAHGLLLLARVCHKTGDHDKAVMLFQHCHRLDPSMWVAFQVGSCSCCARCC